MKVSDNVCMSKQEEKKPNEVQVKVTVKVPTVEVLDDAKYPKSDYQLYRAFAMIQKENLLYYKTLKRLNILSTPHFTLSCGGIGFDPKDKKVYMILNENAIRKADVEDVAGLCEHEVGHLLYEHIFFEVFINNEMADKQLLNQSYDYTINENAYFIKSRLDKIKANENSMLKNGCFLDDLKKQIPELAKKEASDIHSFEIYKLLVKQKEQQQKEQKEKQNQQKQKSQVQEQQDDSQSGGDQEGDQESSSGKPSNSQGKGKPQKNQKGSGGKQKQDQQASSGQGDNGESDDQGQEQNEQGHGGFDTHGVYDVEVDENGDAQIKENTNKKTDLEKDQQKADIQKAVKEALLSAIEDLKKENLLDTAVGQLGGDLQRLVKDMIRAKTDKTVIYDFVTSLQVGVKRSWMKLNPRFPMINRGKKKLKKPTIVQGIDSSGSMDCDEFRGMIIFMITECLDMCEELHIVVGDTSKKWAIQINNKFEFNVETINFTGYGGTDMNFVSEYAKEVEADGIILHTDGDLCREYNDQEIPTKFFIYGDHGKEVPGFENYRVYPE